MPELIPFNRPWITGREMEFVEDSVRSMHTAGNGKYTRLCEDLLREATGSQAALLQNPLHQADAPPVEHDGPHPVQRGL